MYVYVCIYIVSTSTFLHVRREPLGRGQLPFYQTEKKKGYLRSTTHTKQKAEKRKKKKENIIQRKKNSGKK
jgi:hypothetical protein